jgi:transposase
MASFLGIDLSKETFHAFLLSDLADAKKVFPNTPKGFEQLTTWLKNRRAAEAHICMEATGAYWEALALYLHGLEHRVSVVNPARIKAFAQSELLRTKSDAVDAALIARFCKSQSPELWVPPPPEIRVNPCPASTNAPLRPPQENPSAAIGVRTIVGRGHRYCIDSGSHRHA